jgi:hypothetical protein
MLASVWTGLVILVIIAFRWLHEGVDPLGID